MGLIKKIIPVLLLWWSFVTPGFAGQLMVIGSDAAPPLSTPSQTGMLDLIAKEAFSRIGLEAVITPLPSERSLLNANAGLTDGDLVRIAGLSQHYPNLLQVPETTCDFDFVAFSKLSALSVSGWDSLRPYSVGIITGWKILEENVHADIVTKVENSTLLFGLLAKNRVDMVIFNRLEGYGVIKELDLAEIGVLEPPLESRKMFIYLNRKHAGLIPGLVEALRRMKADGTSANIIDQALQPYRQ